MSTAKKATASTSLPTNSNAPIWSMHIEIHRKFLLGRLHLSSSCMSKEIKNYSYSSVCLFWTGIGPTYTIYMHHKCVTKTIFLLRVFYSELYTYQGSQLYALTKIPDFSRQIFPDFPWLWDKYSYTNEAVWGFKCKPTHAQSVHSLRGNNRKWSEATEIGEKFDLWCKTWKITQCLTWIRTNSLTFHDHSVEIKKNSLTFPKS